MPIEPPPGYLTRPEAAKRFNRSQRALERDLHLALSMEDGDVLTHWQLVTKDGEVLEATDVTIEQVKQLVAKGMSPTWYIEEAWLETEYGRKGAPRPQSRDQGAPAEPAAPSATRSDGGSAGPSRHGRQSPSQGSELELLRSENAFMKERIRALQREKQEDAARSERREAKLFAQLDVKDRQISAWDEVTQGLTRGLATGQLNLYQKLFSVCHTYAVPRIRERKPLLLFARIIDRYNSPINSLTSFTGNILHCFSAIFKPSHVGSSTSTSTKASYTKSARRP